MELTKALSVLGRQAPCPHYNVNTNLGSGSVWAKCDDCGATFSQAFLPRAIESSRNFEEAFETIRKEILKIDQYKVLVGRLREGMLVNGLRAFPSKSKHELIAEIDRLYPDIEL